MEKLFDGLDVIKNISLGVEGGEIVSVIGPSGSGKFTLLWHATMLEVVGSKEVIYLGKRAAWTEDGRAVYASRKDLREIQSQHGLVSQGSNLFPRYSVMKNVTDASVHIQKRDKTQVYEEARALLKKMGLEDEGNAYPCRLSGGQCQRVAVTRALTLNPKILFFDEPIPALDPELIGEVFEAVKSLADPDIAMVTVIHEMASARDISDRVVLMVDGVIVEGGTPEQVFASDDERIQSFLGQYGTLLNQF